MVADNGSAESADEASAASPVPLKLMRRSSGGEATRKALLLHGLASSSTVWNGLWPQLPEGLETWAADLPWRGDHVLPWGRAAERSDWIAACLDQVPGGPDLVIAHSFSANRLLDHLSRETAAGRDPLRQHGIKGIVLVSPFYRRSPDDFTWDSVSQTQRVFLQIMEEGIRTHSERRIPPATLRYMADRMCERVGAYGCQRFFEFYLGTPWLNTEKIDVPCLVVAGAQDFTATESEYLAADLHEAELRLIPDCGHYPMAEHSELFSTLVDEFLEKIPVRGLGAGIGI
ncbi:MULTISPECIES: alpha/beta fold hydrolase [unclassified Streptomyces]|uniref:alpha/beta fold hydrolase n=1 Tax=unclassified Streptomyces TaxID=2593676 RepID=UPI00378AA43C